MSSTDSSAGKLGRDSVPFKETMQRYHGEIERLVYAVEQKCEETSETADEECNSCPFRIPDGKGCWKHYLRGMFGDYFKQDDAMPCVPPCQCAGGCGCKQEGKP